MLKRMKPQRTMRAKETQNRALGGIAKYRHQKSPVKEKKKFRSTISNRYFEEFYLINFRLDFYQNKHLYIYIHIFLETIAIQKGTHRMCL